VTEEQQPPEADPTATDEEQENLAERDPASGEAAQRGSVSIGGESSNPADQAAAQEEAEEADDEAS